MQVPSITRNIGGGFVRLTRRGVRFLVSCGALFVWGCSGGGSTSGSSQTPPPELVRTRIDVVYASASVNQKLDLYLPSAGAGPFPLVVWVHGGGWMSGDKDLPAGSPQFGLLARGYAVASINYRFSYEATFPAQIHDVKAAIRFIRGHATEYGLDKNRVAVWGFSAGGHLAALAGTSGGAVALEDLTQGNPGESSRVQAVIDWSGPIDFLQLDAEAIANGCGDPGYDSPTSSTSLLIGAPILDRPDLVLKANPTNYVTADDAPFFIQHGTQDCSVPQQQSQLIYSALAPVIGSSQVTLQFLAEGHGGPLFDDAANIGKIADFLNVNLK